MKKTVEQRFWEKVGPHDDPNTCWLWLAGTIRSNGTQLRYGYFAVNHGVNVLAHRFAYELLVGPIPEGLTLDHVRAKGCTSTLCVNPAHLEPVPQKINVLRGVSPIAINAKKVLCPKGHAYDAINTIIDGKGSRRCLICRRATNLNYYHKKVKNANEDIFGKPQAIGGGSAELQMPGGQDPLGII